MVDMNMQIFLKYISISVNEIIIKKFISIEIPFTQNKHIDQNSQKNHQKTIRFEHKRRHSKDER